MIDPGEPSAIQDRPQSDSSVQAQLRTEIEALKRQLQEHRAQTRRPSSRTLAILALLVVVLVITGFFLGYVPRQRRAKVLGAGSRQQGERLPRVRGEGMMGRREGVALVV